MKKNNNHISWLFRNENIRWRCKYLRLHLLFSAIFLLCIISIPPIHAQNSIHIYQYQQKDSAGKKGVKLAFFTPNLSQYIPHIIRQHEHALALHTQIWQLGTLLQPPFLFLTDYQDDGNGGASPLPVNFIDIGMAPLNMSYYIAPSTERYSHLFKHEYTHIVMTDRPNKRDRFFRSLFGAKVLADNRNPTSMLWSYFTTPRWYAPRWYHEGIACFMETWLSGGVGRALGGYDEMYFRSFIHEDDSLSTVVGLESEGTTKDFQLGTNAYLYGTRFVNYLVMHYSFDKVRSFYNRTEDSKAFFATQFHKVFGKKLRTVWSEWQTYEKDHQQQNITTLQQYPITPTTKMIDKPYGSASPLVIDDSLHVAYTAVNYPGDFAHLERINLSTGKRQKLGTIDGVMLYQTAYVALDKKRQRLFWTDRNGSWRGLRWKSVGNYHSNDTSNITMAGKKKYQRMADIVYDNAHDCLYGLLSHEGITHLVRYDAALEKQDVMYTFNFGVSISDLDVSPDGEKLAMTIVGVKGENSLILFNVHDLDNASFTYHTILKFDNTNLSQFKFTPNGTQLIGTSYYTGVANIWSVDLKDSKMHLLSNTTTGLFAPTLTTDGTIYAMQFSRNGLTPVHFPYHEITDCNAISYLGQKAYEAQPQLAQLASLDSARQQTAFAEIYDSIKSYNPIKATTFQGAYPSLSGFTDDAAWNHVTPVLGYHITFSDPIGIHSVNLSLGVSPWSNNPWKNRFHAAVDWKLWNWSMQASWNKTDFYDLFGPTRNSRKGYQIGITYEKENFTQSPFNWHWGFAINTYGDMDALPMYQNINVTNGIKSFQTASLNLGASKTRISLGGTIPEQGYEWQLNGYTYLANGKWYPTLTMSLDEGTRLPFMRNASAWLRMAAGQNFGDRESIFGQEYFGGFRNNYVDHGTIYRYRTINAMPGTDIDGISAHSFCKAMGEINLQPLRFRNVGMLCLYPTYAQLSLFATDLIANPWGKDQFNNYVSIGGQLNVEVVLFNYMKTTWSFGYARCLNQRSSGLPSSSGEWLISLKLL